MKKRKSYFPEHWLHEGLKSDKLSEQAIDIDMWDKQDLKAQLEALPPFSAARSALEQFAPTGGKAMNDTFFALLKAEPELIDPNKIKPSHVVNRQIAEMMMDLNVTKQLRRYSVNDDVQAALSATTMEPDLETLFDRTQKQRDQAEEFQKKLQELAQAIADMTDLDALIAKAQGESDDSGNGMSDEERQAQMDDMQAQAEKLQEIIDALREAAQAAGDDLSESMDKGTGTVRVLLTQALGKATEEAEAAQSAAIRQALVPMLVQQIVQLRLLL